MKSSIRKALAAALAATLALFMFGCGPDAETQEAAEKINAIGEVTLESGSAIEDARSAYNALDEDQKNGVDNYSTLEDAERDFAVLTVENAIDGMPEASLENAEAIEQVSLQYNKLNGEEKGMVANYDLLEQALAQVDALKAEEEARAKAFGVGEVVSNDQWSVTLERAQISNTVQPINPTGYTVTYQEAGEGSTLIDLVFIVESLSNDSGSVIGGALDDFVAHYGEFDYSGAKTNFYSMGLWRPTINYGLDPHMPERVYAVFSIPESAASDGQPVSVDVIVAGQEKVITIR